MLCPAISDPFYGRLYRLCGMTHQLLLIPIIGKFVVATSIKFNIAKPNDIYETKVFVRELNESSDNDTATEAVPSSTKNVLPDSVKHRNGMYTDHVTDQNGSLQTYSGDASSTRQKMGTQSKLRLNGQPEVDTCIEK